MVPAAGVTTTLAGSVMIASLGVLWWWHRRHSRSRSVAARASHGAVFHEGLPALLGEDAAAEAAHARDEEAELQAEQLSRNTAYLGEANQAKVGAASIVIVGVGGVGSHAAMLLGRTGVRRLRLIDPARVTTRSLGSHAVAAHADLGELKADVVRAQLRQILPSCRVDVVPRRLTVGNAASLLWATDSAPADMVLVCLPTGNVAAARDAAAAIVECLAQGVRCVPVLYDDGGPTVHVAHQRFASLHDVCGSILARRLTVQDAHRAVLRRERETFGTAAPPDVWPEDIEYLVTEVWGGTCVMTGESMGGPGPALTLTRWERARPAAVDNLVMLTKQCAEQHDKAEAPFAALDPDLVAAVDLALQVAGRERRAWTS